MKRNNRKNNPEGISVKEAFSLTCRAFALLWKTCPGNQLSTFLCAAAGSVTPYVGIWISAQILNELAGNHRMIGIISHVTELKEQIDRKLVVTRSDKRSKAAWSEE